MSPIEERLEPYQAQILGIYFVLFVAGCIALHFHVRERWRKAAAAWPSIVLRISCRPWTVFDASTIIGLVVVLNLAFVLLMRFGKPPEDFATLAIGMALMHGVILSAIFAILLQKRVRLRSAFGGGSHRFLADVRTGGIGFLSMIVVVVPAMIAAGLLLKALDHPQEPQEIIAFFAKQEGVFKRVYFAVWTVLIAPVAEEMLFRGILLPLALRKLSPLVAILLVSASFALVHQNASAFLPLVAVSASLCLAYIATESIVVCITMHALFNALTTSFILLT